ncbi:MFS transporter [Streptomyces violascens]|uniref:MFS transporter n=1 Tax=Streptomyces violascens TaxID=67381 RepID=UPI00365D73A3
MGRLPNTMAPIAILLSVTHGGGSLRFGGVLSAMYVLASALSQPVKGRLMDRFGQTRVSGTAVVINSSSLLALAVTGAVGRPAAATCIVVIAGFCTPPLEAGLRALWGSVLSHPAQRRVALALDTGTQGLLFIAGPMLVAFLSSRYGPAAALAATAAVGFTGTLVVISSAPSRAWVSGNSGEEPSRSPLRDGGLRALYLGLAAVGCANGAMTVWAVSMASQHHMDLLSGLIPGTFAAGSLAGGLLFGRHSWPGPLSRQLVTSSAGFAIGWLPLLFLPGPFVATALTILPGVCLPVVTACAFMTVDALAPRGSVTEAYAWLILSLGVGSSCGTALAGALAEHALAGSALPASAAGFAVVVLFTARRHITCNQAGLVAAGSHR